MCIQKICLKNLLVQRKLDWNIFWLTKMFGLKFFGPTISLGPTICWGFINKFGKIKLGSNIFWGLKYLLGHDHEQWAWSWSEMFSVKTKNRGISISMSQRLQKTSISHKTLWLWPKIKMLTQNSGQFLNYFCTTLCTISYLDFLCLMVIPLISGNSVITMTNGHSSLA